MNPWDLLAGRESQEPFRFTGRKVTNSSLRGGKSRAVTVLDLVNVLTYTLTGRQEAYRPGRKKGRRDGEGKREG